MKCWRPLYDEIVTSYVPWNADTLSTVQENNLGYHLSSWWGYPFNKHSLLQENATKLSNYHQRLAVLSSKDLDVEVNCVAVWCSELQCFAVCCRDSYPKYRLAVLSSKNPAVEMCVCQLSNRVTMCCNVLQCVAVACGAMSGVPYSASPCSVAECCSVLEYVAVCCRVKHHKASRRALFQRSHRWGAHMSSVESWSSVLHVYVSDSVLHVYVACTCLWQCVACICLDSV